MALRLAVILAATVASVAIAAPSHAAAPVRVPIDPSSHPATEWTCDDDAVVSGNVAGGWMVIGSRTAPDGTPLMTISMNYTMVSLDTTTGESVDGRGTMHLVIDLATGTTTESGNARSLKLPGQGVVVQQAGRFVYEPGVDDPVVAAGQYVGSEVDGAVLCAWFGHDA
ncbi:hypothetical protein GCM10009623_29720 [Nocardioides aestuarii]|uniref:Allene oxide cyclase barrel-like domain-containing protein n=1 Tax=Nocardioides aestuarii TaxID=252231 RepID=A0ABW4TNX7_9ACTN